MKTKLEIRFADIDMAGHVHNSKYLCYFEQGRIDFLSEMTSSDWDWRKKGLVLGRNEVDYISPIYLNDEICIVTKCDHVGIKSFTLSYELYKTNGENGNELCTKGRSILVCMDHELDKSLPVFEEWKGLLTASLESN